jgi:hypothetical protein
LILTLCQGVIGMNAYYSYKEAEQCANLGWRIYFTAAGCMWNWMEVRGRAVAWGRNINRLNNYVPGNHSAALTLWQVVTCTVLGMHALRRACQQHKRGVAQL